MREKVMSMLLFAFCFAHQIKIIFAYASIHFQFNFAFTKHTAIDILPFPVRLEYSTHNLVLSLLYITYRKILFVLETGKISNINS